MSQLAQWITISSIALTITCCASNPSGPDCGDGTCEGGESHESCPEDCTAPPPATCGDGTCEAGETATTCPADCKPPSPPPSVCGDGTCQSSETFASCPQDCGATLLVHNESSYPVDALYVWQCGSTFDTNLLGTSILTAGGEFRIEGIPPGCIDLAAVDHVGNGGEIWSSSNNEFTAGGWSWTLTNATASVL